MLGKQVQAVLAAHGFREIRDELYIRELRDSIKHGVVFLLNEKGDTIIFQPTLQIFSPPVEELISDVLVAVYGTPKPKEYELPLDSVFLYEVMQALGKRPLGYDFESADEQAAVMKRLANDLDVAIPHYFAKRSSIDELIAYFEQSINAGGTAHYVKLLTMYHLRGDKAKLELLAADLRQGGRNDMTADFLRYMVSKKLVSPTTIA